jgi:hemerythrin-like domain-containing protein
MDALTIVREDHRSLEALLGQAEQGDGDTEARAALHERLLAILRHHVLQEETILYPIFRERARDSEVDLAPLDQVTEQHRLLERLATELRDAGPDGGGTGAKLAVLAEQVRHHLDIEDTVLLSAVEDLIDDDTLLELGRRMEQRDRVLTARQELARAVIPRGRRLAAALGGLAAAAAALVAFRTRRRRPPPPRQANGRRRDRRR